jgi:hypothetical protein
MEDGICELNKIWPMDHMTLEEQQQWVRKVKREHLGIPILLQNGTGFPNLSVFWERKYAAAPSTTNIGTHSTTSAQEVLPVAGLSGKSAQRVTDHGKE